MTGPMTGRSAQDDGRSDGTPPRRAAPDPAAPGGHPFFAAVYGWMSRGIEAGPVGQARRDLVARARGVVVDLGSGLGVNLAHLGAEVTAVHAVEPDPHMVRRLRGNLQAQLPGHLADGARVHAVGAEALPLPDASADTVLATLTLCTVAAPETVAAEIRRVLRPGGRLLVLEHVLAADAGVAVWQRRLRRPWGWFAAGCDPTRDTAATLAAAGFDVAGLRRFDVPEQPVTREWLTGEAVVRA